MKRMFLSVVILSFFYASLMGCQTVEEVQAEENCLLDSCAQQQIVPQVQAQSVFERDLRLVRRIRSPGFSVIRIAEPITGSRRSRCLRSRPRMYSIRNPGE